MTITIPISSNEYRYANGSMTLSIHHEEVGIQVSIDGAALDQLRKGGSLHLKAHDVLCIADCIRAKAAKFLLQETL